jgi:glycosyltransferase involved in cell wall biosynthesis
MSKEVAHFYKNYFNLNENNVLVSPILQLPERLRKNTEKIELFANQYILQYQLKGKKTILFVGRLVPEKALPQFIEIITPLLLSNSDIRLILVGEGVEEDRLKTIVKGSNLGNRVVFAGKHQAEELYGWYACASGFVLPSVFEPYGAVVNEALIFGLKVFCSHYAGASSLIKLDNGLLFNPLDREDTYDRFQQFIENLKPINDISLVNSPPMIEDFRPFFFQEWGKVLNKQKSITPVYNY